MKNVVYGCLCAFLFAATFACMELATTVQRLDTELQITSANLSAVAQNAVAAEKQVKLAAEQQRLYWKVYGRKIDSTLSSMNQAVNSTNTLIRNTDASLNGEKGVLPSTQAAAEILAAGTLTASQKVDSLLNESVQAAHAVEQRASDPNIAAALASTASTAKHIDGITAHVENVSDHYDHVLTDKQTTWQKIKSALWFPIKVAVKVW